MLESGQVSPELQSFGPCLNLSIWSVLIWLNASWGWAGSAPK